MKSQWLKLIAVHAVQAVPLDGSGSARCDLATIEMHIENREV